MLIKVIKVKFGQKAAMSRMAYSRSRARVRCYWCFDLQSLEFVFVSAAKAHKAAWVAKQDSPAPLSSCWPSLVSLTTIIVGSLICGTPFSPTLPYCCGWAPLFQFQGCTLHVPLTSVTALARDKPSILPIDLYCVISAVILASSCNYGQWGIVIHRRIRLFYTSWQPGAEFDFLIDWLILVASAKLATFLLIFF